jgi:hypothetical protein
MKTLPFHVSLVGTTQTILPGIFFPIEFFSGSIKS